MAAGFRVRYRSLDATLQGERILYQLPIRFGRNALNHCQLSHGYISDFHAVVESVDGRLAVRDLQSKNGVYTPTGERISPNVPFGIGATGHAFVLGGFVNVHVDAFEQSRGVGERTSATRGSVLGNRAALESRGGELQDEYGRPLSGVDARRPSSLPSAFGGGAFDVAPLPPLSMGADGSIARPQFVPAASDPAWGRSSLGGSQSQGLPPLAALPSPQGQGMAPRPSAVPERRSVGPGTQHLTMGAETLALLGLRELAASLVPGVPLATTGDVARLLTKLHDTIEVFCRSFVPLREGHAQFVSTADHQRGAAQRSYNRSRSAVALEMARDPASVAAALLDWRNHDYDAPEVVEGILADLMTHQVGLIEGVVRGVQALLEEVSPEKIERTARERRGHGLATMMGRYRALWRAFEALYEQLKNETRTLESMFGPEFATYYREYMSRQGQGIP